MLGIIQRVRYICEVNKKKKTKKKNGKYKEKFGRHRNDGTA